MTTREEPVAIACRRCGSTDVSRDAWANWDSAQQAWVLGAVFDDAYCHRCEAATHLNEQPLPTDQSNKTGFNAL